MQKIILLARYLGVYAKQCKYEKNIFKPLCATKQCQICCNIRQYMQKFFHLAGCIDICCCCCMWRCCCCCCDCCWCSLVLFCSRIFLASSLISWSSWRSDFTEEPIMAAKGEKRGKNCSCLCYMEVDFESHSRCDWDHYREIHFRVLVLSKKIIKPNCPFSTLTLNCNYQTWASSGHIQT